jgi:hypothetical protein
MSVPNPLPSPVCFAICIVYMFWLCVSSASHVGNKNVIKNVFSVYSCTLYTDSLGNFFRQMLICPSTLTPLIVFKDGASIARRFS